MAVNGFCGVPVGTQVTIGIVGPIVRDQPLRDKDGGRGYATYNCDYAIDVPCNNKLQGAMDWELRKINPPEEPKSLVKAEEEELEVG